MKGCLNRRDRRDIGLTPASRRRWLPARRHEMGKGVEANRNKGLYFSLRDKLNGLHRRSREYCKSAAMLSDSIALVCVRPKLI